MKINIVLDKKQVHDTVLSRADRFAHTYRSQDICWRISYLHDRSLRELRLIDDQTYVLVSAVSLSEAYTKAEWIDAIRSTVSFFRATKKVQFSSVILVLDSVESVRHIPEFPEFVSDWLYMPICPSELSRRILGSLSRTKIVRDVRQYGKLEYLSDSRKLVHEDMSIWLTPSEGVIVEILIEKRGGVISIDKIREVMNSMGRSTGLGNIRVAIFQLRIKVETVTKSKMTVANVYKRGYCIRFKHLLPSLNVEFSAHSAPSCYPDQNIFQNEDELRD